jgi:hypothetical protein
VKLAVKERMEALPFLLDNSIRIYIVWNKERGLELLVASLTV